MARRAPSRAWWRTNENDAMAVSGVVAMTGTVAALAGLCGGLIVVGTENASANWIWAAGKWVY